jgi:hypothetical protein
MATTRCLFLNLFDFGWPCNTFVGIALEPQTRLDPVRLVVYLSRVVLLLGALLTKSSHTCDLKPSGQGA